MCSCFNRNNVFVISLISLVAAAMLLLSACDEFFPSERALDHLTMTPASQFMKTGDTLQLAVAGVNGNGATQDLTTTATYSSSATGIATVSATGLVTAAGNGNAVITASAQGQTVTSDVNVFTGTLQSITVAPNAPQITQGQTRQLTATGQFSDTTTADITNVVAWSCDNTSVATVSNTGLVSAVAAQGVTGSTATITASATTATGQVTGKTTVTVTAF